MVAIKQSFDNQISEQLQESFLYCKQLTRKYAKNFYYGICLSTKNKRRGLYAIYTWMKTLDDIVDGDGTLHEKQQKLQKFYEETTTVLNPSCLSPQCFPTDKFWLAFRETIFQYEIPFEYLQAMFDGQIQDMQSQIYQNFSELYKYCYCVASTVGLICIKIWGYEQNQSAEQLAEYLGIAFQLTNILRDITVDAKSGKNYLPGAPHTQEDIDRSIIEIIHNATEYYNKSKQLINYVHPDGRASLRAMTKIYYQIFLKLKSHPERISYQMPIKLSFFRKLLIMLKS